MTTLRRCLLVSTMLAFFAPGVGLFGCSESESNGPSSQPTSSEAAESGEPTSNPEQSGGGNGSAPSSQPGSGPTNPAAGLPPGALDPSYGKGGEFSVKFVATPMMTVSPSGRAALVRHDGYTGPGTNEVYMMLVTADGQPDASFTPSGGGPGWARVIFPNKLRVYGALASDDGSVMLSGFIANSGGDVPMIARIKNGVLDTTFGTGGVRKFSADTKNVLAMTLATMAGGTQRTILLTATATENQLIALTQTGAIDTAFVGASLPRSTYAFGYVRVDHAGRILVIHETEGTYIVRRFSATGVVDATYGAAGSVTLPALPNANGLSNAAILGNGDLVVTYLMNGLPNKTVLRRINGNGAVVDMFAGQPTVTVAGPARLEELPDHRLALFTIDGRIERWDANGMLDTTFATGGTYSVKDERIWAGRPIASGAIVFASDERMVENTVIYRLVRVRRLTK